MDSLEYVDSLVKEYLLFRGFQSTLRALDQDMRSDKLTHLDADKLTSALLTLAKSLDFVALQDLWSALQRHVFPSLPTADSAAAARAMEAQLFRFFIVCAIQQNKPHRVTEYLSAVDFSLCEWIMPWAAIVHVKRPQTTPPFDVYFTKTWVDMFTTSLRNFLERALAGMPLPRLLAFNVERIQRKSLELEASQLRQQVEYWKSQAQTAHAARGTALSTHPSLSTSHLAPLSISTSSSSTSPAAANAATGNAVHDHPSSSAAHTPLGTPTTAHPGGLPHLHPDDEPYLVLEDTALVVDEAPRTRVTVTRDGTWVATDTCDGSVRAWPVGKHAHAGVRVVAPAPASAGTPGVADVVWMDDLVGAGKPGHGPVCAAVFACGWVRCVAVESRSIVADVQLPHGVSAATAIAGNHVVAAGTCGVCVVSIKLASVVCQVGLPAGHADADKVLHVVSVDAAAGSAGRLVVVVSAAWVHIFDLGPSADTLTHTHSLPTPFPPLACFPHPSPAASLALVSSRGLVAVLNAKSAVIDPLLQYSLPGFPAGLASARACAVMPPAQLTLGRTDADAGAGANAQGVHLVVGEGVYLIPQGRMVQDLRPAAGGGSSGVERPASSMPGSRALSRQGSMTSATGVGAGLAAASVAAAAVTVSGMGAAWAAGGGASGAGSVVTSPVEVSRQIGGGGAVGGGGVGDRVTCVGVGRNVIVQGRAGGAVRVVKVMVV